MPGHRTAAEKGKKMFSIYVILLAGSGLAMLGAAAAGGGQGTGARVLNGVFGAGFLVYAIYLEFFFVGGTYIIFFKAFILPAVLLYNFVRSLRAKSPAAPVPS
jgi:hypothetical protein